MKTILKITIVGILSISSLSAESMCIYYLKSAVTNIRLAGVQDNKPMIRMYVQASVEDNIRALGVCKTKTAIKANIKNGKKTLENLK